MPDREQFSKATSVVVWSSSQTWSRELDSIDTTVKNTIWTGSRFIEKVTWNKRVKFPVWLKLNKREIISESFSWREEEWTPIFWIKDLVWELLTHWGSLDITMHAMAVSQIDHKYTLWVIEEIQKIQEENEWVLNISSLFYISYEKQFNKDTHTKWSNVFYPVRGSKEKWEQAALEANPNAKIIDLITFDSPSAKAVGLTFLWIVWDLIWFIENSDNDAFDSLKEVLQNYLWDDYDWIQGLFNILPIRWELKEWQLSMSELWSTWQLGQYLNEFSKKINFAKLSYISWIVSSMYLDIAMKYMTNNRVELSSSDTQRILLDWDKISTLEWIREIIAWYSEKIEHCSDKQDKEGIISSHKDIFLEEGDAGCSNSVSYQFNRDHIETVSEHFWIVPLVVLEDVVRKSPLFKGRSEKITQSNPITALYTWNNIVLRRIRKTSNWKEFIEVRNKDNLWESFGEFQITKKDTWRRVVSRELFEVPLAESENIGNWSYPHSIWWSQRHMSEIQSEIGWRKHNERSTIKEHLWFRLASMFFNTSDNSQLSLLQETFPKFSKFDANTHKLTWKFWKVDTLYENPHLNFLLKENKAPKIWIKSLIYRPWDFLDKLFVTVEVFDNNWNVIWEYKISIV